MKITRQQFKELVKLFDDAWQKFDEGANRLNENYLDELIFPAFNWIAKRTGLIDSGDDWEIDVLSDLVIWDNGVFVGQDKPLTKDLDEIYDYYIGGNNNGKI